MKKIYILLTPLIVLAACKKDHNAAPSTDPGSYELISRSDYNAGTLVDSTAFTYDPGTHLLTGYKGIQYGIGTPPDTTTFLLTYTGNLCSNLYTTFQGSTVQLTFHYNSNNLPDTAHWSDPSGDLDNEFYVFKYNTAGQLSDAKMPDADSAAFRFLYTYDGSGNLSQCVDSVLLEPGRRTSTTTYSNFDNKVNPAKALRGFPTTFAVINPLGTYASSTNNFGTVTVTGFIESGQTSPFATSGTYTYTYNAAGLPTKIVTGTSIINLTYKQY